jgi:hypothetical protein
MIQTTLGTLHIKPCDVYGSAQKKWKIFGAKSIKE